MATKKGLDNERWQDILEIVCENVCSDWKTLAKSLGFSAEELSQIASKLGTSQERCWELLSRWKKRSHSAMNLRGLVVALNVCNQRRISDIVTKLCISKESVDDILAPHLDREVRMREAFYITTDEAHGHWRLLAKKLGLGPNEISDIESCDWGRSREKCMNVLYRWRLMVPLSDYKVGSLIQALNACGLPEISAKLKPIAGSAEIPRPTRRKRKGEAILHVDTELVQFNLDKLPNPGRPKQPFHKDLLRDYALNKIFIRFQDDLDLQDMTGPHELVKYFHAINAACVKEVSRGGRYIVVQCASRDDVHALYCLARSGEIADKVSEFLVKESLLADLGILSLRLKADIYDSELLTVRTDPESTPRPVTQATELTAVT